MPKIDIDMFEDSPKVGDNVKVTGKVKSIDEDSGDVEVSYDDVSIVKKSSRDSDDNNDEDVEMTLEEEIDPNTQTLDAALSRAFPNTQ